MSKDLLKFKVICINTFITLLKAATLNPYKLQKDLDEVDYIICSKCDFCNHISVILISLYLEINFLMGYVTLAANVIALFPILTDDMPHLLLPALIAQSIDHIALNFIEIILGFAIIKTVSGDSKMSIFVILVVNKLFKIIFAIAALNIYSDYYQYIKLNSWKLEYSDSTVSQEEFVSRQSLE